MSNENIKEVEIMKTSDKYSVLIHLLDGENVAVPFNDATTGFQLLKHICRLLHVREANFFGLFWKDEHEARCWLDMDKIIKKKVNDKVLKQGLTFAVKFYHSDPAQIEDEHTRHQIVLQIKKLVNDGDLACSFVTHALLGSYVVQAELGDYNERVMTGNYVKKFVFAPNQTVDLENRIIELHQTHCGQSKIEAEINFLESVRKLPFYGVDLHEAQDMDCVKLSIGVCWSGILIFREHTRINRFAWPRIVKISYSRQKFFIQIRPLDGEMHDCIVSFKIASIKNAKNLWKTCMQHHQFFRMN